MSTQRKYWINYKGAQTGPVSIDNLRDMAIDESAYVWYNGLDDWVRITKVDELASLFERPVENEPLPEGDAPSVVAAEPEPETAIVEDGKAAAEAVADQDTAAVEETAGNAAEAATQAVDEAATQAVDDAVAEALEQQVPPEVPRRGIVLGVPLAAAQPAQPVQTQPIQAQPVQTQPVQAQAAVVEQKPPTNIGWAIAATLLCCTPLGIVAIVMGAMVNKYYNRGDMAAAAKWSERSAWTTIASIVTYFITMPFQLLLPSLLGL